MPESLAETVGGKIFTFGSYRLGVLKYGYTIYRVVFLTGPPLNLVIFENIDIDKAIQKNIDIDKAIPKISISISISIW